MGTSIYAFMLSWQQAIASSRRVTLFTIPPL